MEFGEIKEAKANEKDSCGIKNITTGANFHFIIYYSGLSLKPTHSQIEESCLASESPSSSKGLGFAGSQT